MNYLNLHAFWISAYGPSLRSRKSPGRNQLTSVIKREMSFVIFLKIFKILVRFEIGFKNCKVIVWAVPKRLISINQSKCKKKKRSIKIKPSAWAFNPLWNSNSHSSSLTQLWVNSGEHRFWGFSRFFLVRHLSCLWLCLPENADPSFWGVVYTIYSKWNLCCNQQHDCPPVSDRRFNERSVATVNASSKQEVQRAVQSKAAKMRPAIISMICGRWGWKLFHSCADFARRTSVTSTANLKRHIELNHPGSLLLRNVTF